MERSIWRRGIEKETTVILLPLEHKAYEFGDDCHQILLFFANVAILSKRRSLNENRKPPIMKITAPLQMAA